MVACAPRGICGTTDAEARCVFLNSARTMKCRGDLTGIYVRIMGNKIFRQDCQYRANVHTRGKQLARNNRRYELNNNIDFLKIQTKATCSIFYARKPSFPPLSFALRIKLCLTLESAPISLQKSPITCGRGKDEVVSIKRLAHRMTTLSCAYGAWGTSVWLRAPVSVVELPCHGTC